MCDICKVVFDEDAWLDTFLINKTKGKLSFDLCLESNKKLTQSIYYGSEEVIVSHVKIKYCPMCGAKL